MLRRDSMGMMVAARFWLIDSASECIVLFYIISLVYVQCKCHPFTAQAFLAAMLAADNATLTDNDNREVIARPLKATACALGLSMQ